MHDPALRKVETTSHGPVTVCCDSLPTRPIFEAVNGYFYMRHPHAELSPPNRRLVMRCVTSVARFAAPV